MIRLISFEGGDGSGKTTQLTLLENYLTGQGRLSLSTREPGATNLGETIRKMLLQSGKGKISSTAELFLYLSDRAQHVQEVIQPAIDDGIIVLCDRFIDSTLAYQGFGRGLDLGTVRTLNKVASHGIEPDLTFLLDCPVEIGLSRAKERLGAPRSSAAGARGEKRQGQDRFEQETEDFHERVRRGFLELAWAEPKRVYILDASRSISKIQEEIRSIVEQRLIGN